MENKLCLGTVQFGLKYGIKNEIGRKPTEEECHRIIRQAMASNIKYIDTARAYGDAEYLLGELKLDPYEVKIISKLQTGTEKSISFINTQIKESLARMKVPHINGYMLHEAKDFYNKEVMLGMQQAKSEGLIENIGVSIYDPDDAVAMVRSKTIDYIQIPYNVFDQRLHETDFFELAQKNQVKIFARSAFLQGLLIMDLDKIPNRLEAAKKHLEKFEYIASEYGYTRTEAAFLFSYSNVEIYKTVFGVDTEKQLIQNLELIKKVNGFLDCYNILLGEFKNLNYKILNPSYWNS